MSLHNSYPLVFNTSDEFKDYIVEHRNEILAIINEFHAIEEFNEDVLTMSATLQEQTEELEEMRRKNKEMEELVALTNKRDEGRCATYIGEVCEKQIEADFRECFSKEEFEIDGEKVMHRMDIRINSLTTEDVFGVEIKDKQIITKKDIVKFKEDKALNNYSLGFLLSTQALIPNYVSEIDSFKIINGNEIYIYSNKKPYIQLVITAFIQQYIVSGTKTDLSTITIDMLSTLYNNWCEQKKLFYKMDKTFISYLNQFNINLDNGHLYLAPKTKCRGTKSPYT